MPSNGLQARRPELLFFRIGEPAVLLVRPESLTCCGRISRGQSKPVCRAKFAAGEPFRRPIRPAARESKSLAENLRIAPTSLPRMIPERLNLVLRHAKSQSRATICAKNTHRGRSEFIPFHTLGRCRRENSREAGDFVERNEFRSTFGRSAKLARFFEIRDHFVG
jgi:hypothetical protein